MAQIRLAVAQPSTWYGADERRNLDEAIRLVAQAGATECDLLLFPENFPGPYRERGRFDAIGPLSAAAKEHRVSIVAGTSEETKPGSNRFHIIAVVIGSDGTVKGRYHRTHPVGPYIYHGGDLWDFKYEEADEFPVFDMGWGKLGLLVCSEVFVPEIARILALKGAEVCLMHAGLLIDELGYTDNWRTLVRARAIENLMYTATTVHLFPEEFGRKYRQADLKLPPTGSHLTAGIAMIASPERVLCESHEPGLLSAVLDLDRIRWLRETDEELIVPAPYRTIPGVLKWRRPELYGQLTAQPAVKVANQDRPVKA
jgi:predicted amidohydrolase